MPYSHLLSSDVADDLVSLKNGSLFWTDLNRFRFRHRVSPAAPHSGAGDTARSSGVLLRRKDRRPKAEGIAMFHAVHVLNVFPDQFHPFSFISFSFLPVLIIVQNAGVMQSSYLLSMHANGTSISCFGMGMGGARRISLPRSAHGSCCSAALSSASCIPLGPRCRRRQRY